MNEIDDISETIGSGAYCRLADGMKNISDGVDEEKRLAKQEFALQLILDVPACVRAEAVYEFANDRKFMQSVMRSKAVELMAYDKVCAGIMGQAWKIEMVEAMTQYDDPETLGKVRSGVMNLLVSRSGFLPQIINRLKQLQISPSMLCPLDLEVFPEDGDDGLGPSAEDFLYCEPRMLRWILGMGEFEPWPKLGTQNQPTHISKLIVVANMEGGDDVKINQPCQCKSCAGVRIPTMEGAMVSLTPSECDSEIGEQMVC